MVKKKSCSLDEIIKFRGYDDVDTVFYNDKKDVMESELGSEGSLLLLNIRDAHILIKTFDDGNRSVQLNFKYKNKAYRYFKVSDRAILDDFRNVNDGIYNIREDLSVVISLTGKFSLTNKYYKIVAQIFY